jgi:hypothetical protein
MNLNAGLTEAEHIGVVSPYRQQCIKVRQLLQKHKFGGIDVKVTEEWQGQVIALPDTDPSKSLIAYCPYRRNESL